MGSCWIKPGATLYTKYRSGRTFRGKSPKLPLFAVEPLTVEYNTKDFYFGIGASQNALLVVMYDDKDVAGFTPWAVFPANVSVDISKSSIGRVECVTEKNRGFSLHKLRVLCKVDETKFKNASEALEYYRKKYLKN